MTTPKAILQMCDCDKFIKWANPVVDRRRLLDEDELSRDGMVNELKEVNMILKDISGRILLAVIVMVAILVSVAMK